MTCDPTPEPEPFGDTCAARLDHMTPAELRHRLLVALLALDADDTEVARGAIADVLTVLDLEAM